MTDVYALVRERLRAMLAAAGAECSARDICLTARHCEASTACMIAAGRDAQQCADKMNHDAWVQRAYTENGHICFELSQEFYNFAIGEINAASPLPELPANTDSPTDYALARMLMGARQGGVCAQDACARGLVWAALGIAAQGAADSALRRTAFLAARFGADKTVAERSALYAASGGACACTARLIAYGCARARLNEINGGNG